MRRWLSLVVLLAACSRDLSLPPGNDLALVLPFDTVAPRQKLRLTASGGGGAYVFAFAPNGQRSGTNAVLSSDGAYQAGERGQEQDVVRVTDSSGKFADARITVGPALSITPPLSSVAPGGRIKFVAAGGKPPVRFTRLGVELPDGEYRAGALGNQVDEVVVTDDTNDPLAVARAQISVGSGLVLYPRLASVAPRERLAFVGLGGQPPYLFSLSTSASGGTVAPTIDTTTGVYVAGSHDQGAGDAVDHVVITDANGQVTEALVTVGPGVSLTTVRDRLAPGQSMTAVAAGGKAPYTFSFQARGNHSRATIDAVTGLYVAGPNSGAVDLLQVTDATGSVASCPPVTVGPLEFAIPGGATQLAGADIDGNFQPDLVLLNVPTSTLTLLLNVGSPLARISQGQLTPDTSLQIVPWDLDGDLRDDLVLPGIDTTAVLLSDLFGLTMQPANQLGGTIAARGARDGSWFYRQQAACGLERVELRSLLSLSPTTQCLAPISGVAISTGAGQASAGPFAWWLRRTVVGGPSGNQPAASGPVEFRYLADAVDGGAPSITRSVQLALPAGHRFTSLARGGVTMGADMTVDDQSRAGASRMLMLVHDVDSGIGKLWGLDTDVPREVLQPQPLPTSAPAAGIAAATLDASARPFLAAWDSRTGTVPLLWLEPDGGLSESQRAELGFPVSAAAFVDLDQDGLEDLAASSFFSEKLAITWADGEGSFGRRIRYSVDELSANSVADVDGDGASDLVTSAAGRLNVFWGDAQGRFAVGPSTPISQSPQVLIAAPFSSSSNVDVIFFDTVGELFFAAGERAGGFATPQRITNGAGNIDVGVYTFFQLANFGGAASGPDLMSSMRDSVSQLVVPAALVREGSTVIHRVLASSPLASACRYQAMNIDGAGNDDLLAACGTTSPTRVFMALSSGGGAALSFGPWVEQTSIGGKNPQWAVRSEGLPPYLATTQNLTQFSAVGGTLQMTTRALPMELSQVMVAPLTSGLTVPNVLGRDAVTTLRVLSWSGSAYQISHTTTCGDGIDIGFTRRSASGPLDVLVQRGSSLATTLLNDGAGKFR